MTYGAQIAPVDKRPNVCFAEADTVPMVDCASDPAIIRIRIAFAKSDFERRDYCKFAYQLSHELAHVYLNPLRTNGLIETLCDAASYEALDRLAVLWPKRYADHAPWRDFAPNFRSYITSTHSLYIKSVPPEIRTADAEGKWDVVTAYLKTRQADLDVNITGTDALALRTLGASALRSGNVPWKDMIGLAGKHRAFTKGRSPLQGHVANRASVTSWAFEGRVTPHRA